MPDRDDELQRLRAADPIDHDALPSAQDPDARELFERITMLDSTSRHRPALVAVAAAAAVLIGAVAAIAVANRGDDAKPRTASPTTDSVEPITPGGGLGNCVEMYSLDTLKNREAAFDGTVRSVDGDTIAFTVNRWYRGGSEATTTRDGASTLGGMTSAGGESSVSLEPGQRLLVAGDGNFAWGCGFTQPYDAAVAEQWGAALGG